MGHRQRMYLPGEVYEETIRTEHGTFWLRPDAACRAVAELAEDVSFVLAPLPVWAHLSPTELRARHAALVAEIEAQHLDAPVLGAAALRRQSPERQPRTFVRTPMPRCHASSRATRRRFDSVYRAFRDAYLAASARLRADPKAQRTAIDRLYPPGALARPGWYIAPPSNFQAPWRRGTDDVDKFEVRR